MLLGISSMSAQTLIGEWKADKELKGLFAQLNDDPNLKIDLALKFNVKDINLKMLISGESEGIRLIFDYIIPGTYTKAGKQITAKYDLTKSEFKITSLDTNEPEMKQMLENKELRDMIFKMLHDQVKEQMKDQLSEMNDLTKVFESFTVESVTADKLKLTFPEGATFGFDRMN